MSRCTDCAQFPCECHIAITEPHFHSLDDNSMTTPNIQQLCLAKVDVEIAVVEDFIEKWSITNANSSAIVSLSLFRALRSVIVIHKEDGNGWCDYCYDSDGNTVGFPCRELLEIAKESGIE